MSSVFIQGGMLPQLFRADTSFDPFSVIGSLTAALQHSDVPQYQALGDDLGEFVDGWAGEWEKEGLPAPKPETKAEVEEYQSYVFGPVAGLLARIAGKK